jgi:hypothetical protein
MSSETPPPAGADEGVSSSTTEGPPTPPKRTDVQSLPTGPARRPPSIITPCVVDGMSDEDYHRDPVAGGSLSHSGLKTFVTKSPAHFAWDRANGRKGSDAFDWGHAAHTEVLGTGLEIHRLENTDGRTKDGKAERAEVRARGAVPLKPEEYDAVKEMAAALRSHETAGGIFNPERGHAERSLFWYDERFGIWRRARYDFSTVLSDGRFAIVDYKSTKSADPDRIPFALYDFGYYTQDPYYLDGARALGLADPDPAASAFIFVFQEKTPPYPVTVVEIAPPDREWGRLKVAAGLDRYARCLAADDWPEYTSGIITVSLPRNAEYRLTEEWRSGALDVDD